MQGVQARFSVHSGNTASARPGREAPFRRASTDTHPVGSYPSRKGSDPGTSGRGEYRSRPISRILSAFARSRLAARPELRRDDHSSTLRNRLRASATYPVASDGQSSNATLFGLAPCGVLPATRVATGAVRSYRTFSPLPTFALAGFGRRYIFCATDPSGCPARALPGALPCGVRTFLSLRHFTERRLSEAAVVRPAATIHYRR